MKTQRQEATVQSNFDLKNVEVDLLAVPSAAAGSMTIGALESFRVSRLAVPASKHGLEVLCGGSCETGAQ
jgi:hypothetical protein